MKFCDVRAIQISDEFLPQTRKILRHRQREDDFIWAFLFWHFKIHYTTGWSNWTLLRKLKYFICCLIHLYLFLVWHPSNSIRNTSFSAVKCSWTSLNLSTIKGWWESTPISIKPGGPYAAICLPRTFLSWARLSKFLRFRPIASPA